MVTLVKSGCHNTYPADETIGKQRSRKVSQILSGKKKIISMFNFGWGRGQKQIT